MAHSAALELMVHHHITGLPVLDEQQRVVGVVSDYDLLSLDAVSGKMQVCHMHVQCVQSAAHSPLSDIQCNARACTCVSHKS